MECCDYKNKENFDLGTHQNIYVHVHVHVYTIKLLIYQTTFNFNFLDKSKYSLDF